jgi:hypothetical protein
VAVLINNTATNTDDITLYNPGPIQPYAQTIPVTFTNAGPAGMFQLSASPNKLSFQLPMSLSHIWAVSYLM